mmetsp:Transcript_37978/g.85059  ORF Transcript_37978/g.85059 Transcript_37978/m.85059 type:complete len:228 (-) Transcript_37978:193-876(-)
MSGGVGFTQLEHEAVHAGSLRRKCRGTCGPSWIDVNVVVVHNFMCFAARNGGRVESLCLVGSSVEMNAKSPGQFSIKWPATPEVCFDVDGSERAAWIKSVEDASRPLPDFSRLQQEKDALSQELACVKRSSAEETAAQVNLNRGISELQCRLRDETSKLEDCRRSLEHLQLELQVDCADSTLLLSKIASRDSNKHGATQSDCRAQSLSIVICWQSQDRKQRSCVAAA